VLVTTLPEETTTTTTWREKKSFDGLILSSFRARVRPFGNRVGVSSAIIERTNNDIFIMAAAAKKRTTFVTTTRVQSCRTFAH